MVPESASGLPRPRRSKSLVITLWVLAVAAILEVVLALVAITPRILASARSGASSQQTLPLAVGNDSTSMTNTSGGIAAPKSQPLEPSSIREMVRGNQVESPFHPPGTESSMQGGTTLGIVSAKLEGSDEGSKKLLITIKSRPKEPIDVPQVKVQVYFYDEEGGDISPSKAQVTSSWMSSPVDWRDGEPELLEVRYLPETSDPEVRFAGYVVAIYYKGDLQDYRAEPSRLIKAFPLKYFIGLDES